MGNSGIGPRYPKYPNNPKNSPPKSFCSLLAQPIRPPVTSPPPSLQSSNPSAPPYAHCSQAPTPARQPAARPPPGLLPHSPLHAARGAQPSLSPMSARRGGPRTCGGVTARGERPAGRTRGAEPHAAAHGACGTRRRTWRGARFRPPHADSRAVAAGSVRIRSGLKLLGVEAIAAGHRRRPWSLSLHLQRDSTGHRGSHTPPASHISPSRSCSLSQILSISPSEREAELESAPPPA